MLRSILSLFYYELLQVNESLQAITRGKHVIYKLNCMWSQVQASTSEKVNYWWTARKIRVSYSGGEGGLSPPIILEKFMHEYNYAWTKIALSLTPFQIQNEKRKPQNPPEFTSEYLISPKILGATRFACYFIPPTLLQNPVWHPENNK